MTLHIDLEAAASQPLSSHDLSFGQFQEIQQQEGGDTSHDDDKTPAGSGIIMSSGNSNGSSGVSPVSASRHASRASSSNFSPSESTSTREKRSFYRHNAVPSLSSALPPATSSIPKTSSSSSTLPLSDTPAAWMAYYFFANLSLTLYNKLVMNRFPYPWALTGIHTLCGAIGAQTALQRGFFTQQRLSNHENLVLVAFSSLYTINIAVSNLSLNLVTVPFHQVVRAMTPLFTIVLATVFLGKKSSRATYISLIPVVLGVVFATYGDYYFTTWGLILTLLGTLLAAMKTIVTNMILVGRLKLHPLDLLLRMSPLAFVQCVIASAWTGELSKVRDYGATQMDTRQLVGLLLNGAIAFFLNVVSFTANKKTSALTMTVAANVKQVLTIILAVIIFNLHINPTNLFGITMTLAGGAWYAKVELDQKRAKDAALQNGDSASQPLLHSTLVGITEEKRHLDKEHS